MIFTTPLDDVLLAGSQENIRPRTQDNFAVEGPWEKEEPISSLDNVQRFPNVNERQLLWKVDLRLIPVLSVLYILAFLDRCALSSRQLMACTADNMLQG